MSKYRRKVSGKQHPTCEAICIMMARNSNCLVGSFCVPKEYLYKRTPRECLRMRDSTVPDECYALRYTFFECKHSLLDGRRRFRGPKGY